MKIRIFQKGFNFRQDGPGNRLVYHLQGCNLHCPWCSNPEGISFSGGQEVDVAELVDECERSRKLFVNGGGVTFTGGEATCQIEVLSEVVERLGERGIETALETNGTSPGLVRLSPQISWMALDFKHVDTVRFEAVCGRGFSTLEANYAALVSLRGQLQVRIPLVNGFNADDAERFADYFSARPVGEAVFEFLRYHEFGRNKWKTPYAVQNGFVNESQVHRFSAAFRRRGLKVVES